MGGTGEMDDSSSGQVTDLMSEIRKRVAEKKAAGLYTVDGFVLPEGRNDEPFRVDELIMLDDVASITPDMSLVRSTKPGVGRAVGKAKGILARATSQPVLDLAARQSQFNAALLSYLVDLAQEVTSLRARVAALEAAEQDGAAR